jgi:hypothetical protein
MSGINSIGQGADLTIPTLQGDSPQDAINFQKAMTEFSIKYGAITSAIETVGKALQGAVDKAGQIK